MDQTEFINAIKTAVAESSKKAVLLSLVSPSGRQPEQDLVDLSTWYNALGVNDKEMIGTVIKEAIDSTVFGILCVLDGVRAIEDSREKGVLKLFYQKGDDLVFLNDPNEDYLHDLW